MKYFTRPQKLSKKIHFKIIDFLSEEYKNAVSLREELLRKPFGLTISASELVEEKEHIHIGGFLNEDLCATCKLVPEGEHVKIQRVAVKLDFQSKGLGTALLKFCEDFAKKRNYKSIYCYSRDTAISFYLKNQYLPEGEMTEIDGLLHQRMRKMLDEKRA